MSKVYKREWKEKEVIMTIKDGVKAVLSVYEDHSIKECVFFTILWVAWTSIFIITSPFWIAILIFGWGLGAMEAKEIWSNLVSLYFMRFDD
jgi:hypothetical protein